MIQWRPNTPLWDLYTSIYGIYMHQSQVYVLGQKWDRLELGCELAISRENEEYLSYRDVEHHFDKTLFTF